MISSHHNLQLFDLTLEKCGHARMVSLCHLHVVQLGIERRRVKVN